jgi:hypothetical protein
MSNVAHFTPDRTPFLHQQAKEIEIIDLIGSTGMVVDPWSETGFDTAGER